MNFSSKLLQDAVDEISRLPGIGKNTATRLALNLIKEKDENVMKLIAAIKSLKNGILFCEQCCNLSDKPICGICSNDKRDSSILCIVEDIRDVMAIENTGQFNGLYHVLGGKISPVDGVGPNQLTIDKLVDRVKKNKPIFRKMQNFIFPQHFEKLTFWDFWGKSKNARAEISRKTHRRMPRDLSYETDSGPKTKTENRSIFQAP